MELTLTGGSLSTKRLPRPNPKSQKIESAEINGSLTKHLNKPMEYSGKESKQDCEHCNDQHQHQHQHQHEQNSLKFAQRMMTPNVGLEQLLASSNTEARATALATAVKVGTYEGFVRLCDAIIGKEKSEQEQEMSMTKSESNSNSNSNSKSESLITQYIGDYTLAHWAAKRQDFRFLDYIANIPGALATLSQPSIDSVGMYPIHWAATTGHIPTCAYLLQTVSLPPQPQNQPKLYSTNAFTTSDYDSYINARDKSGNTPLIVAAQYGHADLCAFLVKRGADTSAVDASQDSAIHWAAYKGSTPVIGLLCHIGWNQNQHPNAHQQQHHHHHMKTIIQHHENSHVKYRHWLPLEAVDVYGQTPLHLASLRGNAEAVQYLLEEAQNRQVALRANSMLNNTHSRQQSESNAVRHLLTLPDKEGKTPLDLAIKKQKTSCVIVLQEWEERLNVGIQSSTSRSFQLLQAIKSLTSRKQWKLWMGMGLGNDGDSSSVQMQNMKYPFAGLVGSMMMCFCSYVYYFTPFWNTARGIVWDHLFLHLTFYIVGLSSLILFYKTWTTNPGVLGEDYDPSHKLTHIEQELQALTMKYRRLYDDTIESYANMTGDTSLSETQEPKLSLCHSCHIARPYRSKHCRVRRKCVLLFDHYCPFVGNVVGLYNYAYFYFYLLSANLSICLFLYTMCKYTYRVGALHPGLFLISSILFLCLLPGMTLLVYHTQLVSRELTTNEHQNAHRYDYFKTQPHQFYNPWNRGFVKNLLNRMSPSDELYTFPKSPVVAANTMSCCANHGSCDGSNDIGRGTTMETNDLLSHQV